MKPPRLLFIPLALLLAFFYPDLTTLSFAQKKAPAAAAKKPAPKAPAKQYAYKKAPAKSGASTKGKKAVAARRPVSQQQPENDRIIEIQQALAAKGYEVEPNGVWGQQSVEALKKFQQDQNINNMSGRGKLDSLTLIALGLGPRRETPAKEPGSDSKATEGKNP